MFSCENRHDGRSQDGFIPFMMVVSNMHRSSFSLSPDHFSVARTFPVDWHRLGIVLVALALGSSVVSIAGAQQNEVDSPRSDATTRALKDDVLQWVDQLDASSLAQRRSAENLLIEAGPSALEFLPELKPDASAEAKERLARVRQTLAAEKTQQQSSAITVRLGNAKTLREALEAISRDSGVEFDYRGDASVPIQATSSPLSFWHAVDSVLDQTHLDVNFYGGDRGTLQLVPREEERPSRVDAAAYTGVYRIEPQAVTSRRELRHPSMSGLNIHLEIAWEPRLTPIGLTIPIRQVSGRLDDGEIVRPQETGETIDIATNSDLAFSEFYLPMKLPAGQPRRITSLSGVIRALLPGKKQAFELSLDEVGQATKIDAMTVRIEELRINGPLFEVRIGVQLEDAGRSLESHRHWIFENEVFVRRSDGSRADHLGYEVYRQTGDGVGIGYLFDLGGDASRSTVIYRSPTAVINNEVPFVIQDIPLP